MKKTSHNHRLLTQYLLGGLSEQERDQLEEQYFSDDELLGELLDAEDELIDDYRRGHLSPGDRERFDQRFLTLEDRRREVEFSSLFAQSIAEKRSANLSAPSVESVLSRQYLPGWLRVSWPMPGWAMAASALTVILSVTWTVARVSRLQDQFEQSQARQTEQLEQVLKERDRLVQELSSLRARAVPSTTILSLTLTSGVSRSYGELKTVTPGPETTLTELTLEAGAENYAIYQASLLPADDESAEILVYKRLKAKTTGTGKNVVVRLSAAMLETGDYQIKLGGIGPNGTLNPIGKYLFQVRRQ